MSNRLPCPYSTRSRGRVRSSEQKISRPVQQQIRKSRKVVVRAQRTRGQTFEPKGDSRYCDTASTIPGPRNERTAATATARLTCDRRGRDAVCRGCERAEASQSGRARALWACDRTSGKKCEEDVWVCGRQGPLASAASGREALGRCAGRVGTNGERDGKQKLQAPMVSMVASLAWQTSAAVALVGGGVGGRPGRGRGQRPEAGGAVRNGLRAAGRRAGQRGSKAKDEDGGGARRCAVCGVRGQQRGAEGGCGSRYLCRVWCGWERRIESQFLVGRVGRAGRVAGCGRVSVCWVRVRWPGQLNK